MEQPDENSASHPILEPFRKIMRGFSLAFKLLPKKEEWYINPLIEEWASRDDEKQFFDRAFIMLPPLDTPISTLDVLKGLIMIDLIRAGGDNKRLRFLRAKEKGILPSRLEFDPIYIPRYALISIGISLFVFIIGNGMISEHPVPAILLNLLLPTVLVSLYLIFYIIRLIFRIKWRDKVAILKPHIAKYIPMIVFMLILFADMLFSNFNPFNGIEGKDAAFLWVLVGISVFIALLLWVSFGYVILELEKQVIKIRAES